MNATVSLAAVLVVAFGTVTVGGHDLRGRSTSDFFVASRTVPPLRNAAAVSGEYLSAASYLGIAGLVLVHGTTMLWYGIGYTAGYLVLLTLVAAPLRRSGAYTVSDFAEARLGSLPVRRTATTFVVLIGWLYQIPQLQGAGIALQAAAGAPVWVGALLVTVVVAVNVSASGMRSVTRVQALQFWMKLVALAVPLAVALLCFPGIAHHALTSHSSGAPGAGAPASGAEAGARGQHLYALYSLLVATFLGAMGLPHVIARFYTNPDARSTRRAAVGVLGLLGVFYLLPEVYGALGRLHATDLVSSGQADTVVLLLPGRLVPGALGQVLTALVVAGAFAAFVSTCSGLALSVASVLAQDVCGGHVRGFRLASAVAVTVPCVAALLSTGVEGAVAHEVGLIFSVAASTFCPLLVLGIWWSRLTAAGAACGMLVGGVVSLSALVVTLVRPAADGWSAVLLAQPAAWSVPAAFATMVVVSLATRRRVPEHTAAVLARLHVPEALVDQALVHQARGAGPDGVLPGRAGRRAGTEPRVGAGRPRPRGEESAVSAAGVPAGGPAPAPSARDRSSQQTDRSSHEGVRSSQRRHRSPT